MGKRDLALDLFRVFKTGSVRRIDKPAPTRRIGRTTDPELIADVLSDLIAEREWDSGLTEGNLFVTWASIVGADIAAHTTPISICDGVLTVQTSSTAWATQLALVSSQVLTTIQNDPTGATIEKLVFFGPSGPTWKKGIRTIRNARGARDTYG
ncbi:MAG: DciA family protein [Actinomycetota bacterium]|nr:DciA family protein [Actinomycetota bacterium]